MPRIETIGQLTLSEIAGLASASLAARNHGQSPLSAILQAQLALPLPGIGRFAEADTLRAYWTTPGGWVVEGPSAIHADLDRQLKQAAGELASITEQTGGIFAVDIAGESCIELFELLCNADIRKMQKGDVVRTTIQHMNTFILCNEPRRSFSLRAPGSSAISFWETIRTAARSIARS